MPPTRACGRWRPAARPPASAAPSSATSCSRAAARAVGAFPRLGSAIRASWRSLRRWWQWSASPAGFQHAQLRRAVAALLGLPLEDYSRASMTYDLARLVGHALIAREAGTYRYRV